MENGYTDNSLSWAPGDPVYIAYGGLEFKSLIEADIDERFINLLHDESVIKNIYIPHDVRRSQFLNKLNACDDATSFLIGIFVKKSNKCIGYRAINITKKNVALATVVIFDKDYWRKGVLGILSYVAAKYCFEVLDVVKLSAHVYADNEPMLNFFKKTNYEFVRNVQPLPNDKNQRPYMIFHLSHDKWKGEPPPFLKE